MNNKAEVLSKVKDSLKSNASILGKSYKDREDKKNSPSALNKAGKWIKDTSGGVKDSLTGPKKLERLGHASKNAVYGTKGFLLDVAKTGVSEGRANVVAGKIISNRVKGIHATKAEKKFLGKQAVNNLKTTASVGAMVAANVAVRGIPAPGMTEAIGLATNKLGLAPKKQRIPRRYRNHAKWNKTTDWIDRSERAVKEARKKYNREFYEKNPELRKKKSSSDTSHSYDPDLTKDIRLENWININNHRMKQADTTISMGAKLAGGMVGGVLGKSLSSLLFSELKSRIAYLDNKGSLRSDKEDTELKTLNKSLSLYKNSLTTAGAALGATAAGYGYYNYRKKLDDKDRKELWNT